MGNAKRRNEPFLFILLSPYPFSFIPCNQCSVDFRNYSPLTLFTSCVQVLDSCRFKWRFTIHQKALICTKPSKSRISCFSIVGEDHIEHDVHSSSLPQSATATQFNSHLASFQIRTHKKTPTVRKRYKPILDV